MKYKIKRVNQDDLIRSQNELQSDNTRIHVRTKVEPIPLSREKQKSKLQEQMTRSQGTLTDLGGKPSTDTRTSAQRNADYLHPIKGIIARQKSEWDNGNHLVQGLSKTVGASALIAAGVGYSSPIVTTFSGLGKNTIAGALGTEGFTMLGGRLATPKEIAIGATFEAGLPMVMKGIGQSGNLLGSVENKMKVLDLWAGKKLAKGARVFFPKQNVPKENLPGFSHMKGWVNSPSTKEKLIKSLEASNDDWDSFSSVSSEGRANSIIRSMNHDLDSYVPKDYVDLLNDKGIREWYDLYKRSSGVSYGSPEGIYVKNRGKN